MTTKKAALDVGFEVPFDRRDSPNVAFEVDDGDPNQTRSFRHSTMTESSKREDVFSTIWDERTMGTSDVDVLAKREADQEMFEKAREYLNPGIIFRYVTCLYADRKLLILFGMHFVSTIIVWVHFGLIKFQEQRNSVPGGANRYWSKVIFPSIEFGTMHAILLQMALIPLTMSRYSIAALSETVVSRFIPLGRTLDMHIHLGYTMVMVVFSATILFFSFFGMLCSDGEQAFCDKFTSEIMITGYTIIGSLLIIGGTSYFRHKIPYELFYGIHHLVFIMYALTVIHTLDIVQRNNERKRSQTFKWFSATILYYCFDRAAMYINHRYRSQLMSYSAVSGKNNNGSRMLILKLRRPCLFQFHSGQYVYLRLLDIDMHWHPFSVASAPGSSILEFYVEVYDDASWTGKLWQYLEDTADSKQIYLDVMGPYGTCMAKINDYSHGLAIGAGTGIVPVLSLFKQHIFQLLRLDPRIHLRELAAQEARLLEIEKAEEPRRRSLASQILSRCCRARGVASSGEDFSTTGEFQSHLDVVNQSIRSGIARQEELQEHDEKRGNMLQLKRAALRATRSIYGVVLLCIMPVLGLALLALTISWNMINIVLYDGMQETLIALLIVFQIAFFIVAVFIWDANGLLSYIDFVACALSPVADWFWFREYNNNNTYRDNVLGPIDVVLFFTFLLGYMTARVWERAVRPRHWSWRTKVETMKTTTMDRLELVWVTRSALLVSEIMPDIEIIWGNLVDAWGRQDAWNVCRISVYVTDKDEDACECLRHELEAANSDLYRHGAVQFERPNLPRLIESHTLDMISTRRNSYSLLAFCGSPTLAQTIHHFKLSNDMVTAMTGNKKHQMEYVFESYGGYKGRNAAKRNNEDDDGETNQCLTIRQHRSCSHYELQPPAEAKQPSYHGQASDEIVSDI